VKVSNSVSCWLLTNLVVTVSENVSDSVSA